MSIGPLVVGALAAVAYALGGRGRPRRRREASFYAGVVAALVVLEPPFDGWADTSFALHMTQHVVLISVSAPLVALGRPWPRVWLGLPLRVRRAAARALVGSATVGRAGRALRLPPVSLALMSVTLGAW